MSDQSMHLLRKFEFLWKNVTTNPDEHIIDALIFGSNCRRTQTKLLEKDATLTLDTALDIVRTEEVTSIQVKGISSDVSSRVHVLKHGRASSKAGNSPSKHRGPIIRVCGYFDTEHDISQRSLCPCAKENHWRKVCRASKFSKRQQRSSHGPEGTLG
ncbi:hypothetical protein P5673_004826 [Acropora cervicornis]|uniref:Uncharacterized protein n=1 Tax=Acropora cervicornis TaxID=6130 RepID=A0AAD9QZQ9_ACRCE|nr:hypothetical protein P5673_004826 [Acropora cervicornis]